MKAMLYSLLVVLLFTFSEARQTNKLNLGAESSGFKWDNCGNLKNSFHSNFSSGSASDPIQLLSLTVSPSPIVPNTKPVSNKVGSWTKC